MLTRILAACVGLPLLLAVVLFLPPVATAILFALACGVAAYEMLWRTGILKHRRILVYTIVAAMANVMWSWLRACSIVSEQTLWLCALLGLFVYFCALFCELLAAHTELRDEFPERTVCPVDSMGAGFGTGLLACRAAELRDEGRSAAEATAVLEQEVQNLCEFFTVSDLMFLHRTGRVQAAAALVGTVLNLKPILRGDEEGHIVTCEKVRGRARAIANLAARYETRAVHPELQRVAITHGDCPEDAQALAERIRAIAEPKELIVCPHEPFTGAHVGPGMLGLFFFGSGRA